MACQASNFNYEHTSAFTTVFRILRVRIVQNISQGHLLFANIQLQTGRNRDLFVTRCSRFIGGVSLPANQHPACLAGRGLWTNHIPYVLPHTPKSIAKDFVVDMLLWAEAVQPDIVL